MKRNNHLDTDRPPVKRVCRIGDCDSEVTWDGDVWVCHEHRHAHRRCLHITVIDPRPDTDR